MADWRLLESDEATSSTSHKQSENNLSKSQNNRVVDSSKNSNQSGNLNYNSSNNDIIVSSKQNLNDVNYSNNQSNNIINNNKDIFTENNVQDYSINNIENSVDLIEGAWADAYGKVINSSNDISSNSNDGPSYSDIKDVAGQGGSIVGEQLLYTQIKDAIQTLLTNANSASNNSSNSGPGQNKYNNEINNNPIGSQANSTYASSSGTEAKSAIGTDPYKSILTTIDEQVKKADVDYSKTISVSNSNSLSTSLYSDTTDLAVELPFLDFDHEPSKYELLTYPDAMSNMYDVYFRIVTDDGISDVELRSKNDVLNALLSSRLMSARISEIEIPSLERQTTTISALGTSIDRPNDSVNNPGKSSFTIRGDTRLYYVDAFNELSGTSLGDLFNKGSSIWSTMQDAPLAKADNSITTKAETLRKELSNKYDETIQSIEEEINATISEIAEKYTQSEKDITSEELMSSAHFISRSENVTLSVALVKAMTENEKKLQKSLKDSLIVNDGSDEDTKAKALGKWAAWKEKRQKENDIKKKVRESNQLIKDINNRYNELYKKLDKAISQYDSDMRQITRDEMSQKRKAAQSIAISAKKDCLDYITGAITRNTSVRITPATSIDDIINSPRIDIVVKRTSPSSRFISQLSDKKDERFIFEDVKFLGTGNSITFEKDNAGPKEFSYEFIYKRCYKLDLYDTSTEWVQSQVELFVDRVFDAMTGDLKNALRNNDWENLTLGEMVKQRKTSLESLKSSLSIYNRDNLSNSISNILS